MTGTEPDLTPLLIVLLAVLWGAVLVPAILRARQDTSPIVSVGMFRRSMRAIRLGQKPVGGRWILMPAGPKEARLPRRRALDRRRRIFSGLLILSLATLLLGLLPWWRGLLKLNLAADLLLATYVAFLINTKNNKQRLEGYKPKHSHREPQDREGDYLEAEHF